MKTLRIITKHSNLRSVDDDPGYNDLCRQHNEQLLTDVVLKFNKGNY